MTHKQKVEVSPRAWPMMLLVWAASIMAPLAQFKVTPLSTMLVEAYGFPFSTFGLLMSWMSIIGIVLAFPAAFVTGKLGPKKSILLCLISIILGTFIGAVAPSTQVLFFSRVLEGIGLGLIGITAPSAVAVWFPPSRRGFPMGLWSAWVPVGIVIAFNTSPRIAAAFGVHAVWWAALALTVIVTIAFAIFFKLPEGATDADFVVKGTLKEEVKLCATANIWILALAFFAFHIIGTVTLNTYYPSFLQQTYGMTPVEASHLTSYHTMLCIIGNPLGGFLFERTRRPKLLISLGLLILAIGAAISWSTTLEVNIFFICFTALGIGLVAGTCRGFSIELLSDKNPVMATPVANSVLTFAQRCCDCFAPMIYGAILVGNSWDACNWFAIPVLVITLLLVIFGLKWKDGTPAKDVVRG